MVPESRLEPTENGLVPAGGGWFVLNAREASWLHAPGRSAICEIEGRPEFEQVGVNINVLEPGEPMSMYHWEADQEDFLVLSGEPVLIIEGVERSLRPWDLVHCPAGTSHTILGGGSTPSVVIAIGARILSTGDDWGAYPVDAAAARHGVSVEEETPDPEVAYSAFKRRVPVSYRDGWLG